MNKTNIVQALLLLTLLGALLLLLLIRLGPLLLLLRLLRRLLLGPLLLLRLLPLWLLSLRFLVLFLRKCRDKRPEKQDESDGVGNSNELHSNRLLEVSIRCARRRPVRAGPGTVHTHIPMAERRTARVLPWHHSLRRHITADAVGTASAPAPVREPAAGDAGGRSGSIRHASVDCRKR